MQSIPVTATENWTNWTCVNDYRTKVEQKDFKQVLDRNSEFDATRKRKAQEILVNWKVHSFVS